MLIEGRATIEGTSRFQSRHAGKTHPTHWRKVNDLTVSSIGLGTYLGEPTGDDDAAYASAVRAYVTGAGNVIDTAINYRFQRSERVVGKALRAAFDEGVLTRDQVLVCTKGGYIPFDGRKPNRREMEQYVGQTFVGTGICAPSDIVGGSHCLAPKFIEHQLKQSLENLGLQTIDVYYLHNPETQLSTLDKPAFHRKLRRAFEVLEHARQTGSIQVYGLATWNGFRVEPTHRAHLDLASILDLAHDVAGDAHGLRVVQAPYSLAMIEALGNPTQKVQTRAASLLDACEKRGVAMIGSATLVQAQLAQGLPTWVAERVTGLRTDAQRALQFARSTPGVTCSLVGCKQVAHVRENLEVANVAALDERAILGLFEPAT